jgi:O-acetyl-ADP-ribose deacetylase
MEKNPKDRLVLLQADITRIAADAIVNAANSSLLGGGGVDGAIHRAGGVAILQACKKIVARQGGCKTGEAVITTAGLLPARFVIHTVGPVWSGGDREEPALLGKCYRNALLLAEKNACKTISFPSISTGAYGFPKALAADIAVNTVLEYLTGSSSVENVIFVAFDEQNFDLIGERLTIK